jgi:hypothetical protein
MARFVVSHQLLALLAHDAVLLLRPRQDAIDGVVDLIHGNFGEVATGGENGRFIQQVGQIGPGEARGTAGDAIQIHILGKGFAPGVDLEDFQTTGKVRAIDHHLTVKATGTQQGASSTSGRLVAAMMMMPVLPSNPSISVRSWFRVCSRSSLPPPSPAPR